MTTLGKNVIPIAVSGKFDDCQAMAKKAFGDSLLTHLSMSSANSINVARLLPQIPYYFYAYAKTQINREDVVFAVPCGNFGNLTAGLIAQHMGLPVKKFVAATNANDEFPRFMEGEKYTSIQPSKVCISNAMNVGHPSNLARIISLYGGWMDEVGRVRKMPDMKYLRKNVWAVSISDKETKETMKNIYADTGLVLEPHGAVAYAGLHRFLKENSSRLSISLETAHPAKFPEEVERIIKRSVELPAHLKQFAEKEESSEHIPPHYKALQEFLLKRF